MPSKNDAWGIEVGANAIKAVRLTRDGDKIEMAEHEVLPFKKILTTPDLDVDEAVQVGLDQLMNKHDMRKTMVVASVPGHMAFARFAKLPPVEPKKIAEIVKYEALQQIPFPLEQVEWDYQVFQAEDSPEVEVGIFAITKDRVIKFLTDYQEVGLRVDALTLSPLGVYNCLAHDMNIDEHAPGTIFVDIGTASTDVIIVESGGIWLRTLPIGGNNFTEALVKAFKLTFPKAEKLKREAGTSKYARQIFQAMRPVFADLVQEVQRSLGYYQSLNRDAELTRLVGVGSTFRLPGLTKFLKQQLQLDVRKLDGFQNVLVNPRRESELASNALNLATAYGLALQGLGMEQVTANVLPAHILSERMWKSKQPWFAAAAAVVVAASGFAHFNLMSQETAWKAATDKYSPRVDSAIRVAREQTNKLAEIEEANDPRARMDNLYRIADYRDVWPKMMVDLTGALASLQTQPELLESPPDPEKIAAAIPKRSDRRQLIIHTYTVEFWPEGEQITTAGGRGGSRSIDEDMSLDDLDEEEAVKLPKYKVTVEGVTPFGRGIDLVGQFNSALARSTEGRHRPYVIVPNSIRVPEQEAIGIDAATILDEADEKARGDQDRPRSQRSPFIRGGRGRGGSFGRDFEMMEPGFDQGFDFPGMGPGGGGRARTGDLARLFPEAPDTMELHKDDWRFKIEWLVELRAPEEVRRLEDPNYTPPKPETDEDPDFDEADAETASNDDHAKVEDQS